MPKKLKFKPVITRVKLNPEQAVLACSCVSVGVRTDCNYLWSSNGAMTGQVCNGARPASAIPHYGCNVVSSGVVCGVSASGASS